MKQNKPSTRVTAGPQNVIVIGGGPAGLSAAVAARKAGAQVTLIESSDQLGGQFWRHLPEDRSGKKESKLHHNWDTYIQLRNSVLDDELCTVMLETQVWSLEHASTGKVLLNIAVGPADSTKRTFLQLAPDALVLATGAHDRTLPFPGWDLPGVFTAGAAQAFAKSERIAVGSRVLIAGAGPFLLPVMSSLASTQAKVVGVFEANTAGNLRNWLKDSPWKLLGAGHKGVELVEYLTSHIKYRIPYHLGYGVIQAHGTNHVEAVTVSKLDKDWNPVPGTERTYQVDAVCVSHGFTPRIELAIAAGCNISPSKFVEVSESQETSIPGIYAAGEITSIGGCDAAIAEGEVAGHCAAGGRTSDSQIRRSIRNRAIFKHFAARLEAAHGIRRGWTTWLNDNTILCRCEETEFGAFRDTVKVTSSASLRSTKLTTRAGLGICQGRICGRNVETILETLSGDKRGDGSHSDRRPIVSPVRIGDLANCNISKTNSISPDSMPKLYRPTNESEA